MKVMKKAEIVGNVIGKVELDVDEKVILKLNQNFAIMKYFDGEQMERDVELGLSKLRYKIRNRKEEKKIVNTKYEKQKERNKKYIKQVRSLQGHTRVFRL